MLHQLSTDYPQTHLHIRHVESIGSQNLLLKQEVAIAIHPSRHTNNEQTFESQTIDQMTLVNVIAPFLLNQKPEHRSLRGQLLLWNRVVMQDSASEKSYGVGIHQGIAWGMLPEPVVKTSLAKGELVKLDAPEFGSDLGVDVIISRLKNHPCGPVASACWQGFIGEN